MLAKRVEFDGYSLGLNRGKWGVSFEATVHVTTPEQDPARVTVTVQAQLRTPPATSSDPDEERDQIARFVWNLLQERFSGELPEADRPAPG